jgi:invasion protein IalB
MRMRNMGLVLALLAGFPAGAETSTPSATTATFGAWTVVCNLVAQADGTAPKSLCEMTTRLNLKGQDGQMRPLLAWTIGTPPGAPAPRWALQMPTNVALREGVGISLDKAGADAAAPKPQVEIAALTYLTCTQQTCVADGEAKAALLAKLKAAKTANVSFTLLQGAKRIVVPVSLDGFGDALAALEANGK